MKPYMIDARIRAGRWRHVRRNVYLIGAVPGSIQQERMAACLSFGDGAYVSHLAAADEWGFEECANDRIEVTSMRNLKASAGIIVHRVRALPRFDTTRRGQLPMTTPLKTLIDICNLVPVDQLEFAYEYVQRTGMVSPSTLQRRIADRSLRGVPGIAKLRTLMSDEGARMASALEVIVKQAVYRSQLPRPERQYIITTKELGFVAQVDFAYPRCVLAVEAESWRWHSGRLRQQRDFDRWNRIQDAGWRILHITKSHLDRGDEYVVGCIRRALGGQLPGLEG